MPVNRAHQDRADNHRLPVILPRYNDRTREQIEAIISVAIAISDRRRLQHNKERSETDANRNLRKSF